MKFDGINFRHNNHLVTRNREEDRYAGGAYIQFGRRKADGSIHWIPGHNGLTNLMYGIDGRTYLKVDGRCYQSSAHPEFAVVGKQYVKVCEAVDACLEDGDSWDWERGDYGSIIVKQIDDGELVRRWTIGRNGNLDWDTPSGYEGLAR